VVPNHVQTSEGESDSSEVVKAHQDAQPNWPSATQQVEIAHAHEEKAKSTQTHRPQNQNTTNGHYGQVGQVYQRNPTQKWLDNEVPNNEVDILQQTKYEIKQCEHISRRVSTRHREETEQTTERKETENIWQVGTAHQENATPSEAEVSQKSVTVETLFNQLNQNVVPP
jgi:hypothetical protein